MTAAPVPASPAPITVGVTGHRPQRLDGADLPALERQVAAVLARLADAAPGVTFRLVGSLAEGADTIAADAALARGWRIDAVLPFARADYAADFAAPDAATAFQRHLAAVGSAFELPGDRTERGGAAAAYERAGRIVLAQSDLLLAIWDGDPPAGRGGTAQMVAEAVAQGMPVIVIDPRALREPALLWSGLNAHGFGPEAIETVARGDLSALPQLLAALDLREEAAAGDARRPRAARLVTRPLALAYPLLLALTGVRRSRRGTAAPAMPASAGDPFDERIASVLAPPFDRADGEASVAAQLFRGAFVSNFALAALAVTLSLVGLATPAAWRPLLTLGEFACIAAILTITRAGGRADWHGRWLNHRRLAERLRGLDLSARLGELMLRDGGRITGEERGVARRLGLPDAVVDARYLGDVHARLLALLDGQIAYLARDADRMHRLEHRLHRTGGALFVAVAAVCAGVFALEAWGLLLAHDGHAQEHHIPIGVTLLSAALPAVGAAIYGIRMQGDFAGIAERNAALSAQLIGVRTVAVDDPVSFDALLRLVRRTTDLLGQDVGQWLRASRARPLALPG